MPDNINDLYAIETSRECLFFLLLQSHSTATSGAILQILRKNTGNPSWIDPDVYLCRSVILVIKSNKFNGIFLRLLVAVSGYVPKTSGVNCQKPYKIDLELLFKYFGNVDRLLKITIVTSINCFYL